MESLSVRVGAVDGVATVIVTLRPRYWGRERRYRIGPYWGFERRGHRPDIVIKRFVIRGFGS
jgi:hypothetical protein